MKVLHVTALMDPVMGGGNAERTAQLARSLAAQGVSSTILTTAFGIDEARVAELAPARVVVLPLLSRRFLMPVPDWRRLRAAIADADVVHVVGHWTLLNAWACLAARAAGKPYVVCPAGALVPFGRSLRLKAVYNAVAGSRQIRLADACIAVTASEIPAFTDYGVPASRVTVLPNGVWPAAKRVFASDAEARGSLGLPARPYLLFLGRLSLIKGPDLLLKAFAAIADRYPDYDLAFAGPDDGLGGELAEMARASGLGSRIHFLGYVGGAAKEAALAAAAALVVPSRKEAMSLVALEGAIVGKAVLMTDQCGFAEIGEHGGEIVAASAEGIAAGLDRLLGAAERLGERGERLRAFVAENYLWEIIARRHAALFAACIENKGKAGQ